MELALLITKLATSIFIFFILFKKTLIHNSFIKNNYIIIISLSVFIFLISSVAYIGIFLDRGIILHETTSKDNSFEIQVRDSGQGYAQLYIKNNVSSNPKYYILDSFSVSDSRGIDLSPGHVSLDWVDNVAHIRLHGDSNPMHIEVWLNDKTNEIEYIAKPREPFL